MAEPIKMIVRPVAAGRHSTEGRRQPITHGDIGTNLWVPTTHLEPGRSYELVLTPVQTREERLRDYIFNHLLLAGYIHRGDIDTKKLIILQAIQEFEESETSGARPG